MNFSGNSKANKAINVFVQRLNQSRKSIRAAKPQQKKSCEKSISTIFGKCFSKLNNNGRGPKTNASLMIVFIFPW